MLMMQIQEGVAYVEDGKPFVTQRGNGVAEQGYTNEKKNRLVRFVPEYGRAIFILEDVDTGNDKGGAAEGD